MAQLYKYIRIIIIELFFFFNQCRVSFYQIYSYNKQIIFKIN